MTRVKKKKFIFLIGLIYTILFISISQYNHISSPKNQKDLPNTAQIDYDDESLTISRSFFLKKYAENKDSKGNITSIDIELPDTTWNITDLELNFTDIKVERELQTIESNFTGQFKTIRKQPVNNFGFSIQLNILKNTTIYGLYIFGYTIQTLSEPIKIQIQGFDDTFHIPDGHNYISQELNISGSPGWYYQNFTSDPIPLQKGNYSLVLNGTNILSPSTFYYWAYNSLNPIYPELYTSRYNGINWNDVAQNSPFLCKLYTKSDTYYDPEKLNMTVEVDGEEHEVIDGLEDYTGRAVISNKNFNPNDINLHIPIKINKTIILNFSLNYRIKIFKNLISGGSLKIKENSLENIWRINPIFNREYGENFSVEFEFPNNWRHLRVYRDTDNLTKGIDYVISGNTLSILNDTIPYGTVPWEITANSTKFNFELTAPKTSFNIGENLGFYVESPAKKGNYTFVLVDSIGEDIYINSKQRDVSDRFPFNYTIPSSARTGDWIGYVFWNNITDAGLSSQEFQITGSGIIIGPPVSPSSDGNNDNSKESEDMTGIIILAVVLIGGITSAVSISSYEGFKRLKSIRDRYRTKLLNQFKDLMNLNYIMITEKKSGLNIFEQYIAGQEIDATLISGFLNAIRAFGIELTKSNDQSQTISLEYKDSKVLMSEFKNFRIIVIMKERPSEHMINSITDLSYSIENKYSEVLDQFKGNVMQFAGINDLIEEHLHTSFISPLKIVEQLDVKLSFGERAMINKAKELMKEYNLNYFHSTYLISEQHFKPSDVENILNLINKRIFQPTSLDSAGFKKLKESKNYV